MEIYNKETKELTNEFSFRAQFPNTSFPVILTADTLAEFGYGVVLAAPQPTPSITQTVVRDGVETDSKGNVVQKWKLVSKFESPDEEAKAIEDNLNSLKIAKKAEIDAKRKEKESNGVFFEFSDGIDGTIQTRNGDDIRNILAITTSGLVLKSSGETDPIIPFRDTQDVIHMLTPTEAITLGMKVQQFISSTYAWSWNLKSQVDICKTAKEIQEIQIV